MKDLIEALQIFAKYTDSDYPTMCSHDLLFVLVDPEMVSDEDRQRLDALSFSRYEAEEWFVSYRFGAA